MKTILIISVLLSIGFSRLILPSQTHSMAERAQYSIKDSVPPTTASSTANPVTGIANATSGYLSVNDPNNDSKLFYIFYSCRSLNSTTKSTDVPIIIWLQGGPGGSSLIGDFVEQGPWEIKDNKESPRQYSWNDYYNMLYIDNPRGTGYSIAADNSYLTTETAIAHDFIQALTNFYGLSAFAQYINTPLYIFGESYAGHYIPSIAQAILQYNQPKPSLIIPLKGVAIGDGWTDPVNQLSYYGLFGYANGLIDDVEYAKVQALQVAAVYNVKNQNWGTAAGDFDTILDIITAAGGNLNVYNFRDFGNYDFTPVDNFMNTQDTCTRYHIDANSCGSYQDENMNVYDALGNDFMNTVSPAVAYILNAGLPVMLYNGQDDIICNSPDQQNWITNLNWTLATTFYNNPFSAWVYQNGSVAGLQKQAGNLTFVIVNKAGHLAPFDQINTTTEMARRFIAGQTNWTNPLSY